MWTPESVATLQRATRTNEYSTYKQYAEMINEQNRRHMTLRGLFQITPLSNAIPIDQVEPWTAIVTRFATGAMSLGSISTEGTLDPSDSHESNWGEIEHWRRWRRSRTV
jgi:glutamate synthase domain-containing protein 2